ncbi:MDR family MFS transporter [Streptomyces sp. NPDC089919]|uniref:MDR family MFS transporter n=1 Tax=Streptomyces sp. NPDC089919 TaxID=3155188 RepID=UPI00341E9007
MATTAEAVSKPQEGVRQFSVRLLMLPLLIAMLLAQMDNMIVGTAMPTVVSDLGGFEHLSWVVTAYSLATAAATPIWGKLGDMYGRKNIFMAAIVIFLIGSALSGMAQDMNQLIGFRVLQGLGAGGIYAGVLSIMGDLVPPREQGKYQGMMASLMAVAMIGGPTVGGAITDHMGWRWAFYINIPLGLAALAMISTMLHLPKRKAKARVDYLGAALLTGGITALVLTTTWGGNEYAWGSGQILGLGAAGVVVLAGFVFWETRAAEPIMPLYIFRNRNYSLMAVIGTVIGFVMFGAVLYLPLFQQTVQGVNATNSGLLLMPMLGTMIIVSSIIGKVTTSNGRYRIYPVLAGVLMAIGMYLLSEMDSGTSQFESGVYMAVFGAGLGCVLQLVMVIIQNSVEMKDMGVASASVMTFRMLGGSIGVAVMGSLFNREVKDAMGGQSGASVNLETARVDADSLAKMSAPVREAYRHATAAGTHTAFLVGAVAALVALAAGLFVKQVALRQSSGPSLESLH